MIEGRDSVQWQEISVEGSLNHRGFPLVTALDNSNIVILGGEGSDSTFSVFNVLTNRVKS